MKKNKVYFHMSDLKYFDIVREKIVSQLDSKEYVDAYSGTEQGLVDRNHAFEVVELVKELWSENDKIQIPEALLIAALIHDSDRFYPKRETNTKNCPKEFYGYRKGIHSGMGALIFFELNYEDLPIEMLRDVCFLVLRHERGGDVDKDYKLFEKEDEVTGSYNLNLAANYLYYADKMSYFKSNIYEYKKRGLKKLREKIDFSLKDLPNFVKQKILNFKYNNDSDILKIIKEISEKTKS